MTISITLGYWLLPTIVTVGSIGAWLATTWRIEQLHRNTGYIPDIGGALVWLVWGLIALIVSLTAWLLWALI